MILAGKATLVTGAASGIGEAIARSFASAGADVALADIDRGGLDAVAKSLASCAGQILPIIADCGAVTDVRQMVDETVERFGRLDILVNNAGVTFQVDLLALDEAEWDRVNRVNIKGPFFALQRAAAQMIAHGHGGRIINIASISGRGYANSANAAYSASKGALIALTQFAANALAPHRINVNAICPGLTETDLFRQVVEARAAARGLNAEDVMAEIQGTIPIGRVNTPDDIAAMARFLASEGARNITGQAYNVDGGLVKN